MMITRFMILSVIGLVLCSCSTRAEWVRRDYAPEKKGVLRYKNIEHVNSAEKLQSDAGSKMAAYCGNKERVKILSEQLGEQVAGSTTDIQKNSTKETSTTVVNRDAYTYVYFECI